MVGYYVAVWLPNVRDKDEHDRGFAQETAALCNAVSSQIRNATVHFSPLNSSQWAVLLCFDRSFQIAQL